MSLPALLIAVYLIQAGHLLLDVQLTKAEWDVVEANAQVLWLKLEAQLSVLSHNSHQFFLKTCKQASTISFKYL